MVNNGQNIVNEVCKCPLTKENILKNGLFKFICFYVLGRLKGKNVKTEALAGRNCVICVHLREEDLLSKVIINKSRREVSLVEQDTIEYVS